MADLAEADEEAAVLEEEQEQQLADMEAELQKEKESRQLAGASDEEIQAAMAELQRQHDNKRKVRRGASCAGHARMTRAARATHERRALHGPRTRTRTARPRSNEAHCTGHPRTTRAARPTHERRALHGPHTNNARYSFDARVLFAGCTSGHFGRCNARHACRVGGADRVLCLIFAAAAAAGNDRQAAAPGAGEAGSAQAQAGRAAVRGGRGRVDHHHGAAAVRAHAREDHAQAHREQGHGTHAPPTPPPSVILAPFVRLILLACNFALVSGYCSR